MQLLRRSRMTAGAAQWLFAVVMISFATTAAGQMQGLIGGHLSWAVDPEFMDGDRYVDFELMTTFVQKEGCSYVPGSTVQCPASVVTTPPNGIQACGAGDNTCKLAEFYGVLCVAQLMEQVNGQGRRVYYVPRETNNPYFAQCVHQLNIRVGSQVYVVDNNGAQPDPLPTAEEVGKVNAFTVMQVYDQNPLDADLAEDRWRHGTKMVVGKLTHRVKVHPRASGVVAWLAPRIGFTNLLQQHGLLLPACTASASPPRACLNNIGSLERTLSNDANTWQKANGAAIRAWSGLSFSAADGYWRPTEQDRFKQNWGPNRAECGNNLLGCHESGSPALETLVPLCSSTGTYRRCEEFELFNYYSPVVAVPHVVEVTLSTAAGSGEAQYLGDPDPYSAPHRGFNVQGYDLDGHKMTQYTNGLYKELQIDQNQEKQKKNNDRLRVDCIMTNTVPAGDPQWWPLAPTPTGCRQVYDYDRNADNARGNILKPDYAYTTVDPQKFYQHVVNTVDFSPRIVPGSESDIQSHVSDSAIVQNIFATFPCNPGTQNLPPVIETTQTNYTCNFWEPCRIEIRARDLARSGGTASNEVTIQPALGMPFGAANELVLRDDDQQECRGTGGSVACVYRLLDSEVYDSQAESFFPSAVGRIFLRCVVAYDIFASPSDTARTCPSAPFCFKIQIAGSRPVFVAPTPLGRSFNDQQQEVVNRHDYVTCEDTEMRLPIKVDDGIPAAFRSLQDPRKRLRIYVYDAEISTSGGFVNPNFFEGGTENIPQFESCGQYVHFGAQREGSNAQQTTREAKEEPRSVVSDYLPDIEYTSTGNTLLEVTHTPRTQDRNGIVMRLTDCGGETEPDLARCRVKQVNVDQVICAVGYDNSRSLTKRWVGVRNAQDGSGGDYASDTHCWLIRVAAPPVFVTDPAGLYTPFGDVGVIDTSDNAAAYRVEKFRVGEERTLTFLAQDPNSKDTIEVLILASPGIPRGMIVGESECVPTNDVMCQSVDVTDEPIRFEGEAASACSRAKRTITWSPGPEAAGDEFTICAVARDDSALCARDGGPRFATEEGWFGERHCVRVSVEDVVARWEGSIAEYASETNLEWEVMSYVGCEEVITLQALSRETGLEPGQLPYKLMPRLDGDRMEQRAVFATAVDDSDPEMLKVTWNPQRGMEGQTLEVCFAAEKEAALQVAGEEPMRTVCRGGPQHLVGCMSDQDCTEGGRCLPMCLKMMVQRCEYCVKDDDTLTWVVRQYGFETNWLRLWALNSYQGSVGAENIPEARFEGGTGKEGRVLFTDPDLIIDKNNAGRFRVGAVFSVNGQETAFDLAARFRTTLKTLLSMNPDVDWASPDRPIEAGQQLCIVPCTAPGA
mmetsp:Transcript_61092/g.144169  ORF Transcript_61092/g.144169 Transcript_61092/m.144169 type:complete len:1352 (+) Transcript_61092:198-4253(+)